MINLRYHIVSIVAVFLALGIGLALGSTFVDSILVSNLERQVNQLESSANEAIALRSELEGQLAVASEEQAAFEALAEPLLGDSRLEGVPVMIIAPDSVEREHVERVRDAILDSEAQYSGILWLTPRLDLSNASARSELANLFSLAGNSQRAVTDSVMFLISQAMFDPAGAGLITDSSDSNALTVFRDANYMAYEPTFATTSNLRALPLEGTVYVIVTDLIASEQNSMLLAPLLKRFISDGRSRSVGVAEFGFSVSLIDIIRDDPDLRESVSTVDGVETFAGLMALMVALDDLPQTGHYGARDGADSLLPS